tara:strand:- start:12786 stop:14471 length:1686 start_codon:yes stop_codon:yes gene_type:complete
MSSITNQIVANIKKTSTNFNSFSFINSENVVCIDTSLNRIGINRKTPVYSIDISGDTSNNAVRVHDLHIHNLAKINEISSNKIDTKLFTVGEMDVNFLTFNTISGNLVKVGDLYTNDVSSINIKTQQIKTTDIGIIDDVSASNLYILSEISCNELIKTKKLIADEIVFPQARLEKIDAINGDMIECQILDLSVNTLTASDISTQNLFVKNKFFALNESSFNHIKIDGDASLNNLNVDTIAIISEISANKIEFNELSGNSINATTITSNGSTIINNGVFGDVNSPTSAVFNNLIAHTLDISKIIITDYLDNSGVTDLSNGTLILPEHKIEFDSTNHKPGTITFDNEFNMLKIYNTKPTSRWNNILFNINYATMSLRRDISGNDISYDIHMKRFEIDRDNSHNLILDKDNFPNFKYIPITFDSAFGNKIDISNNSKTIEIKNREANELFEIHATIGIKYLNRDPGDVEPNVYTFGLYPHMNTFHKIQDSIDNSFAHLNNTVLAFDNSYNYANTSINYIGPLANINLNQNISDRSGFNFYISSNKDIKHIAIDQFNGTIKQMSN